MPTGRHASRAAIALALAMVALSFAATACRAPAPPKPPAPARTDAFTLSHATVDKDEPPAGLPPLFAQSAITIGGTNRTGDVSAWSESLDMPFEAVRKTSSYEGTSGLRMNGTYDYATGSFEGSFTITLDYRRTDTSTIDPAVYEHTETISGSLEGTTTPGKPPRGEQVRLELRGTQDLFEHVTRKGSPAADEQSRDEEWVIRVVYVVE